MKDSGSGRTRRYVRWMEVIFGIVVGVVGLCAGVPEIRRHLLQAKQIDVDIAWYENDGGNSKLIKPQDVVVNLSVDDLAKERVRFRLTCG